MTDDQIIDITDSNTEREQKPDTEVDVQSPESQANEDDNLMKQLEKAKEELAEQKDKHLRLFAEFDNYKKRTIRERIELIKTASQDIILELLVVVDDFERAMKWSEEQKDETIFPEGMRLVYIKLLNILQSKGLTAMESTGEIFNPQFHEAITEFPAATEDQKGKVFDTVEKGYLLHDKIIRFAKVVVAK